jgi:hypothetical protein
VVFVISDGDAESSAVSRTVTVIPVNDVPVLAGVESDVLSYTENDAATAVSPSITVSDLDSLTDPVLDSATVTISSGLRGGDVLAFPGNVSGVSAAYDAVSGELSLSGGVSVSDWQAVLRSVTYSSSSEDPTGM